MRSENFNRHFTIQGVSEARYTSPIPPVPTGDWISLGPSFVPEVRVIPESRHYSLKKGHRSGFDCSDGLSAALP
jgi:hypothetical protein